MLFNSFKFLIFFPIVVFLYYIVPGKLKKTWLLLASYYFYMCWNAKYVVLILFSTVATYVSGILIERCKRTDSNIITQTRKKKLIVIICIVVNLLILCYFKYLSFFFNTISSVLGLIKIDFVAPTIDVLLPVGISFYTFQALGYIIDVYRDEIYAEKNFITYALFVSFFPQLVAGPIERSKNLIRQVSINHKFDYEMTKEGILLMIWGYFLKIVVADRIAIFVDAVYGDYEKYGGTYLIVATILFAIQIYCDFGGYSIIAMGAAKCLGIDLMSNFNAPYCATSVANFWRRWHISLTSWFKDYLYIPLGGSRKGQIRKHINRMIVFLVSGLWHGANLSFVMWGAINGLYQIIGELCNPVKVKFASIFKINREAFGSKLFCVLSTFILVDFSWIFFRANSLHDSLKIIKTW